MTGKAEGEIARDAIRRVLEAEARAIMEFAVEAPGMADAVTLIHKTQGPLIVSGIGKSGHVARKIASTFRSLGKPAVFLHPAEASHGDLGLVQAGSAVLVLSNSGETTELSDTLSYCAEAGVPVIGITGRQESALAKASTVAVVYGEVHEACRNGLAPTTSTTLTLAIGDALAVAVSELMGAAPDDFRKYHPGGKLGVRLMRAGQLMRAGDALPIVQPGAEMSDVMVVISEKSLGVAIVAAEGRIEGIITDGDLRRNARDLWSMRAKDIATRDPIRISPETRVIDAMALMSERKITSILVADQDGKLAGLLHIHDCLRAGAGA